MTSAACRGANTTWRFQSCYLSTVREQMRLYRNRMTPWLPSSLNCNTDRSRLHSLVWVNVDSFYFQRTGCHFLDLLTHWMCSRMNFLTSSFLLNVNSCNWNTVGWFAVINPSMYVYKYSPHCSKTKRMCHGRSKKKNMISVLWCFFMLETDHYFLQP